MYELGLYVYQTCCMILHKIFKAASRRHPQITRMKIFCNVKANVIIQGASRETDVFEINITLLIFSVEFIYYHEIVR